MVRVQARKRNTRRKQRAGGLGNTLRRAFGFKPRQVAPNSVPQAVRPGSNQGPWYTRIFRRKPNVVSPTLPNDNFRGPFHTNPAAEFIPDTDKAYAYLYQRLYTPRGPLDQTKVSLTPEERSELRKRFLQAIYEDGKFKLGKPIQQIIEELYGRPYDEIESEFSQWDPMHHRLDRILSFILRSQQELNYQYETFAKCTPVDNDTPVQESRTFQDNGCVGIYPSIATQRQYRNELVSPFFIVLNPKYIVTNKTRYNTNIQDGVANVNTNQERVMISLYRFPKSTFIVDALANKGMKCIHPILGYMTQKLKPELWTPSYFADYSFVNKKRYFKSQQLEDAVRIVVLTLQYYAAVRRYAYTKSHELTSQVYEVDPRTIANELRSVDVSTPKYTIVTGNASPSTEGYTIRKDEIQRELEQNQMWAVGKVVIKSLQDKQLNSILPVSGPINVQQFSWMRPELRREKEPYEYTNVVPEETSARAAVERNRARIEIATPVAFGEEDAEVEALQEAEEVARGEGERIRNIQRRLEVLSAPRPTATRRNNTSWIRGASSRPVVAPANLSARLHSDPNVARYRRRLEMLRAQPTSARRNLNIAETRRLQQNRMNQIRRNLGV